ncbi:Hsp70 family protein [Brachybacterium alimentarium]|uniref:Hsp70 family protein n=1 Tax=Brachybacterium alimentarium TaxID=47845 RepID=UPI003FD2F18E
MARALGIDLGTTNSAVAVMGESGQPEIVASGEGKPTTPSVVLFKNAGGKDRTVVGTPARRQASVRPDDVVEYVKRFMGDPSWRFDSSNDEEYRAEDVSAVILAHLVQAASAQLGEQVEDVVITVPAYFDDARRMATKEAGSIAGLNVLRVLNEPTAAALAYGVSVEKDGYLLVYDLGGGTFDVTILGIEGRSFEVLATDGDRNLGGFDWDNALMNHVAAELQEQGVQDLYDDPEAMAVLRVKSEQAKRALSYSEITTVEVPLDTGDHSVEITRRTFEEITGGLLRRTQEIVEDTLDDSGLEWEDLDQILLVGGSTRMPAVHELLERVSGRAAADGVNPDEVVALGAAIQAGLSSGDAAATGLGEILVQDVTSHALGTIALDSDTEADANFVVIPKNAPIPAQGSRKLQIRFDADHLIIDMTQGDDPDPELVTEIGQGQIELGGTWPAGTPFRLGYRYDVDQTVHVEVYRLPEDTSAGSFVIDRVANMTQTEIAASAEKLRDIFPDVLPGAKPAGPEKALETKPAVGQDPVGTAQGAPPPPTAMN